MGKVKKVKKDIRHNVRMTKVTFDIIDEFDGDSFTTKFENLVDYYFLEKKRIEDEIQCSKNELQQLQNKIYEMKSIIESLSGIEKYINTAMIYVKELH